ncbi:MAG TPA: thiamine pyrophosphate-dependent enzyme [Baekduia sp.]|nr:thiamine pyrophosphate-dependent enzyme [Baekduia sp.]
MPRSSDLRRTSALAELVDDPARRLIVSGLGTAAFDAARLTDDGGNLFAIDGAMGAAVSVGLGLALARPDRSVLVITGDGEVLMNVGALATAAVQAPANLSILCIDNGVWGLTGAQATHTSHGADLTAIAAGCGIATALTVASSEELAQGRAALADDTQLTFVRLALEPEPPEPYPFDRDGAAIRRRFRDALAPAR